MILILERIPETMHAVVLTGHGGPDQLVYRTDVPVPRPAPTRCSCRFGPRV